MIRFDCISIFPEMFAAVTESGITRRALEEQRWVWQGWNPRDFAENAWRRVDDRPFGGGPGMVMQPGPLEKAIAAAKLKQREAGLARSRVIYLSPQGAPLTHERVMQLATGDAPPKVSTKVNVGVTLPGRRHGGGVLQRGVQLALVELEQAVALLSDMDNAQAILAAAREIDKLESEADQVLREAITASGRPFSPPRAKRSPKAVPSSMVN